MVEHQFLYKNLNCDPEAHHILALSESGGGVTTKHRCASASTQTRGGLRGCSCELVDAHGACGAPRLTRALIVDRRGAEDWPLPPEANIWALFSAVGEEGHA